jgi:transcriptional regulator with XRE-family HTH domain
MTHHTGHRRWNKSLWQAIQQRQGKESLDPEQFRRNLGQMIRRLRREKRLTQEDLAELASVNAKYLGDVELGKANPTLLILLKVSSALGLEMSDLLFGCESPGRDDALVYGEIMGLVRKLRQPDLQKFHKVLRVIVE